MLLKTYGSHLFRQETTTIPWRGRTDLTLWRPILVKLNFYHCMVDHSNIYIYIYIYLYIYIYIYIYPYDCVYLCVGTSVATYAYGCVYVNEWLRVCVPMAACIVARIYAYG